MLVWSIYDIAILLYDTSTTTCVYCVFCVPYVLCVLYVLYVRYNICEVPYVHSIGTEMGVLWTMVPVVAQR